jgi:ABC-type uncharacterized transport system ATPase component
MNPDWLKEFDRIMQDDAHALAKGMTINEASEIARRTGNMKHLTDHWDRTRVALVHDVLRDLLDNVPAGLRLETVARLEDAARCLRDEVARFGEHSA